jgi:hypothetical protein
MKNLKSTCCNEEVIHFIDNKYICSECNTRCSVYNRKLVLNFIIGTFIFVVLSFVFLQNTKLNNYIIKNRPIPVNKEIKDIQLNDSSITNKLIELGCILPNVALAQIKLESGHYKSKLTYTHKNIAGIMQGNEYKKYDTYEACLKDYIKIQNRYLNQIHKRYAMDSTYVFKLKQIK